MDALRVCIGGDLSPAELPAYLERIGWPGRSDVLASALAPYLDGAAVARIMLDLDLDDGLLEKLGVECYLQADRREWQAQWCGFFDPPVDAGLCRPEKRDAMLAWPGVVAARPGAPWPAYLRRSAERVGPHAVSAFVRALNHGKLVYQAGELREARAYLLVRHEWLSTVLPARSRRAHAG